MLKETVNSFDDAISISKQRANTLRRPTYVSYCLKHDGYMVTDNEPVYPAIKMRKFNGRRHGLGKLFVFKPGDRNNGYTLHLLFRVLFFEQYRIDVLLAKYPPGSEQRPHIDYYKGLLWVRRLVVPLKDGESGGNLIGPYVRSFLGLFFWMDPRRVHTVTPVLGKKTRWAMIITFFKDVA